MFGAGHGEDVPGDSSPNETVVGAENGLGGEVRRRCNVDFPVGEEQGGGGGDVVTWSTSEIGSRARRGVVCRDCQRKPLNYNSGAGDPPRYL